MTIFDVNEKIEFLATQSLHYDRYTLHGDKLRFLKELKAQGE